MSGNNDFEPRFERRSTDRTDCELLHCPLGRVADLSDSGMQVRGKGRPTFKHGQVMRISLNGVPHPVEVLAEAVWIHRLGGEGFAAGFRFRDLDESTIKEVEKLAQTEQQIGAVTQAGLVRFPDIEN